MGIEFADETDYRGSDPDRRVRATAISVWVLRGRRRDSSAPFSDTGLQLAPDLDEILNRVRMEAGREMVGRTWWNN